jgi:hypothetical protein
MSNKQKAIARPMNPKRGQTTRSSPASNRKFAEQRTVKQQAVLEARVRRNRMLGIGSIVAVLAIVLTLVVVNMAVGNSSLPAGVSVSSPAAGAKVPPALMRKLQSIPLSSLVAAPRGGTVAYPQAISDRALDAAGKPELLYVGAEFCPICAAERWAMYVALSKFGTFSPQPGQIHSAFRDGDIPTLTFYKTTFTSRYFTFTPVETTTNQPDGDYYVTLERPTSAEQQLWESHTGKTFPWLDFGGRMELTSAQFNPAVLEGQSFDDIASQIGDNSTPIGADVDAAAKVLIQSICRTLTSNEPADVCSAIDDG